MLSHGGQPGIAVVLSIHLPDLALLARLLASIRAQEGVRAEIFAVLDGPETAGRPEIRALLADGVTHIVDLPQRQGVRNAFAAGLRAAVAAGRHDVFAYADQDDVWHPAKLRRCLAALTAAGASLVHCDARVIAPGGAMVAPSLHRFEAREEPSTLLDHIVQNCVTGMTAVFGLDTARLSLSLLDDPDSGLLHDHTTAIAAAALGPVVWIDEALVDYMQHDNNSLGAIRRRGSWPNPVVWLRNIAFYRAVSLAGFADRRRAVCALHAEGLAPADLAAAFLAAGPAGRLRLARFFLAASARYLAHWQTRRWVVTLRLLDGALRFRDATPITSDDGRAGSARP